MQVPRLRCGAQLPPGCCLPHWLQRFQSYSQLRQFDFKEHYGPD